MLKEANIKDPKTPKKFVCKICDFSCSKQSEYNRHETTRKHVKANNLANNANAKNTENADIKKNKKFNCEYCNTLFKHLSSLSRHRKKCKKNQEIICDDNNKNENENITNLAMEIIKSNVELQKQNSELQKQNNELQKQVLDVCKNMQPSMINSHNNSHNNTFNLQFFLNEQCKDAMNITDFVNSLTLQLGDLEKIGSLGYVNGISSIIIKELKGLDVTKRPVHCSDAKRETLYIKDEDKWEKECPENAKIKKAIRTVEKKNINLISEWTEEHPSFIDSSSSENDDYLKIMQESMGGKGDYEQNKNKIIKKIAKEVVIDK